MTDVQSVKVCRTCAASSDAYHCYGTDSGHAKALVSRPQTSAPTIVMAPMPAMPCGGFDSAQLLCSEAAMRLISLLPPGHQGRTISGDTEAKSQPWGSLDYKGSCGF